MLQENLNISVSNHFCGWKHFFHDPSQCSPRERAQMNTTLALVLWKNPFDWLLSMHRNPYHLHMHFGNSIADFIRRPMALVDSFDLSNDELPSNRSVVFTDPPFAHNVSTNPSNYLKAFSNGAFCTKHLPRQMHWQYDVFCPESPNFRSEYNPPFYELDPMTGRPFPNIMRLRSAKVRNFKLLGTWLMAVEHVRTEELISDHGRRALKWLLAFAQRWDIPTVNDPTLITSNPKHPTAVCREED